MSENIPIVMPGVTLLVFSCEGRSSLLQSTIASFRRNCDFKFTEIIWAHDGEMDPAALSWVGANRIVQNVQRAGYVCSIIQALSLVRTPYVFWLEDDWEFTHPIDVSGFVAALEANQDWLQIRLSKVEPLDPDELACPLNVPTLYESSCGFSANPHLGSTRLLQAGFSAYSDSPPIITNTFESFLNVWVKTEGAVCGVLAPPADVPSVNHIGYLESTGREWHAASALVSTPTEYSSGMRDVGDLPSIPRRMAVAAKVVFAAISIAIKGLVQGRAYDLAFRFIALAKQKGS